MSDPIAAAEAAGKARDIANRFETAVFLIAYGIAEKDGLYEADPHRYPYSQAFRHGMNILAALCAECSDDAEELLPTFNESDFIRNSAASDVREWTARWRDECREAVEGCRSIEIGPLASVDGDYFAATSECYEVLRFAENDLLGGHQERRVYEFLRAGTQEQYVYGRRMLIRHPLLTWNEYVRIKTGLALGDPDPLDQGEADTIDPVWLQEFVSMAYEPVPGAAKVCPNCGWTMTMRGKQPHCSSATCAKAVTGATSRDSSRWTATSSRWPRDRATPSTNGPHADRSTIRPPRRSARRRSTSTAFCRPVARPRRLPASNTPRPCAAAWCSSTRTI